MAGREVNNMIKISVTELEKLYNDNLNSFVCKKLGISVPTLVSLLKKNNIRLKGKGYRKKVLVIQE